MPSIQRKISFGFYAFAATIAVLAMLAYSDLRYLEQHIEAGVPVRGFLNAVLELRRYEKNYFLYATRENFDTAYSFAGKAAAILEQQRPAFVALSGSAAPDEAAALLERYRERLAEHGSPGPEDDSRRQRLQTSLRELGHRLVEIAENMQRSERSALAAAANRSQWILIAAVGLITLLGIGAARFFSRAAVQPMAWLEAELAAIGEGRFNQVEPVTADREIVSMARAINRMLAEIDLRNRHLVQSEKLVSLATLVSGMAHELNNPLSNISTSCQILMEELEQGTVGEPMAWLTQIDQETERARRIVHTVLDFARENQFLRQEIPLRQVIDKALVLLGRRRRASISLDLPDDLMVYADEQRLQQVFVNLIKNAVDAGGPEVEMRIAARAMNGRDFRLPDEAVAAGRCGPAADQQRIVVIELQDNGPGIAPADLKRIFDPFFTTKDVGHGTGLGLYVCQEIIDQHDGCIAAASGPERGMRFLIGLPGKTEGESA
ncbi:MAG: ATP-binding protein [Gammaproteobacteria bacterium]